jgi:hypothetical protein
MGWLNINWYKPLGVIAMLLLCIGCSNPGSEYIGRWQNIKDSNDTIEIVRNNESFLIIGKAEVSLFSREEQEVKTPAVLEQGMLKMDVGMAGATLSYVSKTDRIVASAVFAGSAEYQRIKSDIR